MFCLSVSKQNNQKEPGSKLICATTESSTVSGIVGSTYLRNTFATCSGTSSADRFDIFLHVTRLVEKTASLFFLERYVLHTLTTLYLMAPKIAPNLGIFFLEILFFVNNHHGLRPLLSLLLLFYFLSVVEYVIYVGYKTW